MKLLISRIIAILLLVIPGLAAAYGFIELKQVIFQYVADKGELGSAATFQWLRLIKGIVLFLAGVGFIGGWTFYRDRKRNYLAPKFMPARQKPNQTDENK
jgi:hypothetical protein